MSDTDSEPAAGGSGLTGCERAEPESPRGLDPLVNALSTVPSTLTLLSAGYDTPASGPLAAPTREQAGPG